MISDEAGSDRAKLIQPEVMVPPLVWLVSDAAGRVTGRRFLGVHSDPALPPEQAAEKAGAPVAWTSIATMPITPSPLLTHPAARCGSKSARPSTPACPGGRGRSNRVEGSFAVLADYIGPHKIMWATDYPHSAGFFPGAP
jgi:hypothetical protein